MTEFVRWYNHEHLHSAIRYIAPADRHAGREAEILCRRRQVYECARARNPERWRQGHVRNWQPVGEVWLNKRSLRPACPDASDAK